MSFSAERLADLNIGSFTSNNTWAYFVFHRRECKCDGVLPVSEGAPAQVSNDDLHDWTCLGSMQSPVRAFKWSGITKFCGSWSLLPEWFSTLIQWYLFFLLFLYTIVTPIMLYYMGRAPIFHESAKYQNLLAYKHIPYLPWKKQERKIAKIL